MFIISIDTAATDSVRERLVSEDLPRFDLVVFDEAHKLAWGDPNRPDSKTRRYRLAEALGQRSTHLLLLTATPHMGKRFPYYALWRLLDSESVLHARCFRCPSSEKRTKYFIRRLKEEMVDYHGQPIYKPRLCQTIAFRLSSAEGRFYDAATDYLKMELRKQPKQQQKCRRHGGRGPSTPAGKFHVMPCSNPSSEGDSASRTVCPSRGGAQISLDSITSYFDTSTAEEYDQGGDGYETEESVENQALSLARPSECSAASKRNLSTSTM